jgi:hypothetical protein
MMLIHLEERRLDAARTGRSTGASKMLKSHPPGRIHVIDIAPWKKKNGGMP